MIPGIIRKQDGVEQDNEQKVRGIGMQLLKRVRRRAETTCIAGGCVLYVMMRGN